MPRLAFNSIKAPDDKTEDFLDFLDIDVCVITGTGLNDQDSATRTALEPNGYNPRMSHGVYVEVVELHYVQG